MTQVVAERMIYGTINGVENKVIVRLWSPEPVDDGSSLCRYSFEADVTSLPLEDGAGHGFDDVQALIQALYGIGWTMDQSGIEWSMFPEEQLRDAYDGIPIREDGFPRAGLSVMFCGTSFRKRIESYVEGEKIEAMKLLPKLKKPPRFA